MVHILIESLCCLEDRQLERLASLKKQQTREEIVAPRTKVGVVDVDGF